MIRVYFGAPPIFGIRIHPECGVVSWLNFSLHTRYHPITNIMMMLIAMEKPMHLFVTLSLWCFCSTVSETGTDRREFKAMPLMIRPLRPTVKNTPGVFQLPGVFKVTAISLQRWFLFLNVFYQNLSSTCEWHYLLHDSNCHSFGEKYLMVMGIHRCINNAASGCDAWSTWRLCIFCFPGHCTFMTRLFPPSLVGAPVDMFS